MNRRTVLAAALLLTGVQLDIGTRAAAQSGTEAAYKFCVYGGGRDTKYFTAIYSTSAHTARERIAMHERDMQNFMSIVDQNFELEENFEKFNYAPTCNVRRAADYDEDELKGRFDSFRDDWARQGIRVVLTEWEPGVVRINKEAYSTN